jgi:hypothetical protein
MQASTTPANVRAVGLVRISLGIVMAAVLAFAYTTSSAAGASNPFNYFGYFTNQTSLLTSIVLIATGAVMIAARRVPPWLTALRGVATACLLIVAVVYNVLVPGTGSAPLWVSVLLHVVFPVAALLDWLLTGDRPPLPWRNLWIVLPYPILWLTVVLTRGVTDGWVPYGFLLPERGAASLTLHTIGLLTALLSAGAVVWAASRSRGIFLRGSGTPYSRPEFLDREI